LASPRSSKGKLVTIKSPQRPNIVSFLSQVPQSPISPAAEAIAKREQTPQKPRQSPGSATKSPKTGSASKVVRKFVIREDDPTEDGFTDMSLDQSLLGSQVCFLLISFYIHLHHVKTFLVFFSFFRS